MKKSWLFVVLIIGSCTVNKRELLNNIGILADDRMTGRAIFTHGIDTAANFIESQFKRIGLYPFPGEKSFQQTFINFDISVSYLNVKINDSLVSNDDIIVLSDNESLSWDENTPVIIDTIKENENFSVKYKSLVKLKGNRLVLVDKKFSKTFRLAKKYDMAERLEKQINIDRSLVFIIGYPKVNRYDITFRNGITKKFLSNIIGFLPGNSRSEEYVIFSAHYDHLGVIEKTLQDSIANGADDDASGIGAILEIARHYKKQKHSRSIIFAAFTGEESGLLGSSYFATKIPPEKVVAMINIEMVGKQSTFGRKSAYVTGYNKSDLGSILQDGIKRRRFIFFPDPYPEINLFNRSDNAPFASLGVPAHTITNYNNTTDTLYHTVKDESQTLNARALTSTLVAIIKSTKRIINGEVTPKRIQR